jgi:DNA-binding NtrC family response regulator
MGFTPRVRELLLKYQWPGNIRELRDVVKSIVLVAEDFIEFKHLPLNIQVAVDERKEARPGDYLHEVISRATEDIERKMILQSLQDTDWNHLRAAKALGVDPKTLYRKLKEYGIKEKKD